MRRLNPLVCGVSVGLVLGLWHLGWAILVASGAAKLLMDFVLRLHFLNITYALVPFDVATAALLVLITAGVGLLTGIAFAAVWNWLTASGAGNEADRRPLGSRA